MAKTKCLYIKGRTHRWGQFLRFQFIFQLLKDSEL